MKKKKIQYPYKERRKDILKSIKESKNNMAYFLKNAPIIEAEFEKPIDQMNITLLKQISNRLTNDWPEDSGREAVPCWVADELRCFLYQLSTEKKTPTWESESVLGR